MSRTEPTVSVQSFCPPPLQGARVKTEYLKAISERIKAGAQISVTRSFPTCSPFTAKVAGLRNKTAKSVKIQVRHCHAQRKEWLRFHGDSGGRGGSVHKERAHTHTHPPKGQHQSHHTENPRQPHGDTRHISSGQPEMSRQDFPQSRSWWRRFLLSSCLRIRQAML